MKQICRFLIKISSGKQWKQGVTDEKLIAASGCGGGCFIADRQEIMLSTSALISGEWKFMLPDLAIPGVSAGACAVAESRLGDDNAVPLEPVDVLPLASAALEGQVLAARGPPPNVSHPCQSTHVLTNTGCTTAGHYNGDGTAMVTR